MESYLCLKLFLVGYLIPLGVVLLS
eukprot:COSAG02_NODE_51995_length_310_cov_1.317536_1_plen_24_part_10